MVNNLLTELPSRAQHNSSGAPRLHEHTIQFLISPQQLKFKHHMSNQAKPNNKTMNKS